MKNILGLAMGLAVSVCSPAFADLVTDWNQQVVTAGGPQIWRTFAMVHIAMFDAINAIDPRYHPYLILPEPPLGASTEAAAASAAHGVLVRLFPAQKAALDTALNTSLAAVPDGQGKTDGVLYGDLVAQAIYEARLSDHILEPGPPFVPGTEPGDYVLTSPSPAQPVSSNAPNFVPFALSSASQFRPNGPSALTSPQYAKDLAEVAFLGGSVNTRTPDEAQLAAFHTEPAHFQFNRIARAESAADGRSLIDHARFFALLNLALADATIGVFEAKYFFRFWRPSTAIHNADIDGNDRTVADPTWTPFLTTPQHPEYPAAHGAAQAAGARVMKSYFGPNYAFSTTSPTVPGALRFYDDFDAFVAEGRAARIFGGMHFRSSLEEGARQGIRIANWVIDGYLLPLKEY